MSEVITEEIVETLTDPYEEVAAFADMIEPLAVILEDDEIQQNRDKKSVIRLAQLAVRKHSREVIDFLSLYNGKQPGELGITRKNIIPMFAKILKDQNIKELFFS